MLSRKGHYKNFKSRKPKVHGENIYTTSLHRRNAAKKNGQLNMHIDHNLCSMASLANQRTPP